jgi:hypothetical protein
MRAFRRTAAIGASSSFDARGGELTRVKAATRSNHERFMMFGNSARAQYVLRYLALTEAPLVGIAIAANSGGYMLPDLAIDYPTGRGGLDLEESSLHRSLELAMASSGDTGFPDTWQ